MTSPESAQIVIRPAAARWRVRFEGHVIADSADALILEEPGHTPVVYFPREDVSMEYMSRTDRATHCPYKGEAAYYTLLMDGDFAENAVWTYEEPAPQAQMIRGRLAFYPNRVEIYPVAEADVNPRGARPGVADVVRHTDAGDGTTQADHWPAP
ncbi:DUF427 domain-containing protein [Phenylobacterium sp.]|jgi:uncharacterized protein (DUF427 family)|uniref:DUF427 domain-containing protein n=1 Tax=Phenylobacterium sp. TaxID=1871053 RepID=UPI002F4239F2